MSLLSLFYYISAYYSTYSFVGNLEPSSSPGRDLPPFEDEADNMDNAGEEEEGEELFGENLER